MIQIKNINDLTDGDVIFIEGMEEGQTCIVTVKKVTEEGKIVPHEINGEYEPEKLHEIVVLGRVEDMKLVVMANMNISLSTKIIEKIRGITDQQIQTAERIGPGPASVESADDK